MNCPNGDSTRINGAKCLHCGTLALPTVARPLLLLTGPMGTKSTAAFLLHPRSHRVVGRLFKSFSTFRRTLQRRRKWLNKPIRAPLCAKSLGLCRARSRAARKSTYFWKADGLEIDGSISNSLTWNGRPITVDFILRSPQQGFRNEYFPTVRIAVNGELIGRIAFTLACNMSSSDSIGRCAGTATPYRKAFLSYSSQDRVEVLKRAQSLRLAKIDIFQDVLTLQPADRWREEIWRHVDECDLFLLFWSRSAKESEWVEKEVKYALDRQKQSPEKLPDIIPVIIEGPPPVAPPSWLSHLHFNDPICYFIAGSA